jgi:hypothetical protein
VKPVTVKPAAVETATTVKTATAVETAATAMHRGVGWFWRAERNGAQQRGCDWQSPPHPGLGSRLA